MPLAVDEVVGYAVEGWGVGELRLREGLLVDHAFRFGETVPSPRGRIGLVSADAPHAAARGREGADSALSDEAADLLARLQAFLAGESVEFTDVPLDLEGCTPFQESVLRALRAVPRGQVVTYGELAALAGHPRAQRAVGTVCARNRFVLVVPCHRVVAAEGIGGYGDAGPDVKRRLLALEGVVL
ncbi:MAG: methylated-DNA--[protein]-cysteine S-methyltransferase [Thermoleophilia bacterium]|nr:methylated-DNA--[protein]-cysteine S-methyltransferase [Thermoleophilia bacterium]